MFWFFCGSGFGSFKVPVLIVLLCVFVPKKEFWTLCLIYWIPWMICKVDNLKWVRSTIKREVKEKLTEGISPKKKVGKRKTKK